MNPRGRSALSDILHGGKLFRLHRTPRNVYRYFRSGGDDLSGEPDLVSLRRSDTRMALRNGSSRLGCKFGQETRELGRLPKLPNLMIIARDTLNYVPFVRYTNDVTI